MKKQLEREIEKLRYTIGTGSFQKVYVEMLQERICAYQTQLKNL